MYTNVQKEILLNSLRLVNSCILLVKSVIYGFIPLQDPLPPHADAPPPLPPPSWRWLMKIFLVSWENFWGNSNYYRLLLFLPFLPMTFLSLNLNWMFFTPTFTSMVVTWRKQHIVWMKLDLWTLRIDMSIANVPSTSCVPIKFRKLRTLVGYSQEWVSDTSQVMWCCACIFMYFFLLFLFVGAPVN